jgi:hypothetical protein
MKALRDGRKSEVRISFSHFFALDYITCISVELERCPYFVRPMNQKLAVRDDNNFENCDEENLIFP